MNEAAFSYSLLPTLHNFNYCSFEKPETGESILLIREYKMLNLTVIKALTSINIFPTMI